MNRIMSGTALKRDLETLLSQDDFKKVLDGLTDYPAKKTINALISFLCHRDDCVRWRSVSALGFMVSRLFETSPEESRIIMRRFMWMLNEESGGIGWGVPETMGETMARCEGLGQEYNRILVSYLNEDGNYLDHGPLRTGVLWGLAILSETKPHLISDGVVFVRHYLYSSGPMDRGLACMICGSLGDRISAERLNQLSMDKTEINLYKEGYFTRCTVSDLAGKALNRLS